MIKKISKRFEISCGIVIVRLVNNKFKFLLLRSGNHWDFPKGRMENGESLIDTALREVFEETTINAKELNFKWGRAFKESDIYKKGKKIAVYFIAQTDREKIELPFSEAIGKPENDEYRWLSYKDARKLFNPRLVKILDWANETIK